MSGAPNEFLRSIFLKQTPAPQTPGGDECSAGRILIRIMREDMASWDTMRHDETWWDPQAKAPLSRCNHHHRRRHRRRAHLERPGPFMGQRWKSWGNPGNFNLLPKKPIHGLYFECQYMENQQGTTHHRPLQQPVQLNMQLQFHRLFGHIHMFIPVFLNLFD